MPDHTTSPAEAETLTWQQTRWLIRSDFERLVTWYGGGSLAKKMFWFLLPNYQAVFLYRLYRYLYLKGWRNLSRLLFLFSLYATDVEISPATSIGPSCLITHAFGVILFGKIGARLSVYGQSGTGGGININDIGAGPGYPIVGDDVVFGIRSGALGAIRIGDRVKLGPGAVVLRDVPNDAVVLAPEPKILKLAEQSPIATGQPESPVS
jgi:serine O-acetyltransferase